MDEQLENRLRFLREANTEGMPHSDRGLFDHLLGTRQVLVEWGAGPALCDAGLFHSIYSTEHFEQTAVPLTRRDEVLSGRIDGLTESHRDLRDEVHGLKNRLEH